MDGYPKETPIYENIIKCDLKSRRALNLEISLRKSGKKAFYRVFSLFNFQKYLFIRQYQCFLQNNPPQIYYTCASAFSSKNF